MKSNMFKPILLMAAVALLCVPGASAQNTPNNAAPQNSGSETNADDPETMLGTLIQAIVDARDSEDEAGASPTNKPPAPPPRFLRGQGTRGTAGSSSNAVSLTAFVAGQRTNQTAAADAGTLRLNFRNAPLSMVLDYLSEAAGFTISANSKVDLKGSVTVWSNQPVDRDEAVRLLHKALSEHNYAATVEGKVLNIYVVDAASTEILAGVPNNDYTSIPATRELVTQIVYVHNVETGQLINSLTPLMPSGTSMTANQGANAIVITDTRANIRRMVQLVKALDTASVSASTVRVFPLTYADATALAQVVQQLFQTETSSSRLNDRGRFGGFFPPFGDRGRGDSSSGSTQAGRVSAAKVVAAADDRSNSLVVSASTDQMALVEELVNQMDVNVDDVVELRVFRLQNADPQEIADQLVSLFPDPTTQQNSSGRSSFRGSPFFGGFRSDRGSSSSTDPNSRKVRQTRVTAVPDPRTRSVIVSAARDLMMQIGDIITELDSDPAKKKKIFVIRVENRDPEDVVEDLQSVIATDNSGNLGNRRTSTQRAGSQLNTRQQNILRNTGTSTRSGTTRTGR